MAKKDKKKGKKKDKPGADAVGAVRTAVERTFQATADSAQSTRTRAQDLVDDVTGAAVRVREVIEQLSVLEDLKKQVDTLQKRVAALESSGASKPASRSTSRRSTSSRAKSGGGTTRKTASSRASGSASSAKSTSSRSTSSSRSTAAKSRSTGSTRKTTRSSAAKKTT
jgi:hypothetical protein